MLWTLALLKQEEMEKDYNCIPEDKSLNTIQSKNTIIEWVGLEGTLKDHLILIVTVS